MPKIENVDAAFKLADDIFLTWRGWHERLADWRAVTDRQMQDTLSAFKEILPDKLKAKWWAYQSPDVQNEAQNLAHILASNPIEIEVISKSSDPGLLKKAQQLEEADEALMAEIMPLRRRILRYVALMTDGVCIEAVEAREPGEHQKAYANRGELEAYADGDEEPDDDDTAPRAVYKRAVRKHGDHEKAYAQVMREAAMMDECLADVRLVQPEQFAAEFDEREHMTVGCERAKIALSACISLFERYGVKREGERLVIAVDGKSTEQSALTSESRPMHDVPGAVPYMSTQATDEVEYVQIRRGDEIVIAIRGVTQAGGGQDDGILIRLPNPFEKSLGYVLTTGTDKIRSVITQRMEPYLLPLMVETQVLNALMSGMLALAWAEASREEYEIDAELDVNPIDGPGQTKAPAHEPGGQRKGVAAGEVKRIPTTDLDLKVVLETWVQRVEGNKSKEYFSGTGTSGDSGRLLARLQTAQLTKLVPIQAKCSLADKEKLNIIHGWIRKSQQTITIAQEPALEKSQRTDIQVAKPQEITPKLAALPVSLRVTTGANTPEGEYALQQVGRDNLAIKAIGITTYRSEYMHAKDPQRLEEQMVEDEFTMALVGAGIEAAIPMIQQRAQQIVDAILPPPPPPPADPTMMMDPNMAPPPANGVDPSLPAPLGADGGGANYLPPAVPMQEGNVPDVTGAGALAV